MLVNMYEDHLHLCNFELETGYEFLEEEIKVNPIHSQVFTIHEGDDSNIYLLNNLNVVIKKIKAPLQYKFDKEYRIGKMINTFNLNYMMRTYGYFEMRDDQDKIRYCCIIMKYFNGFKLSHVMLDIERESIYYNKAIIHKLVLLIIRDMQEKMKFTHYDLNMNNIMVGYYEDKVTYKFSSGTIKSNYSIKIIDYGRSYLPEVEIKEGNRTTVAEGKRKKGEGDKTEHSKGEGYLYFPMTLNFSSCVFDPLIDYSFYLGNCCMITKYTSDMELLHRNNGFIHTYDKNTKDLVGFFKYEDELYQNEAPRFIPERSKSLTHAGLVYQTTRERNISKGEIYQLFSDEVIVKFRKDPMNQEIIMSLGDKTNIAIADALFMFIPNKKIFNKYSIMLGESITYTSNMRVKSYVNTPEDFFNAGMTLLGYFR